MPRFSSYPAATTLADADTFLIHQDASGLEKQITGGDVASSLIPLIDASQELVILELKLLDVSTLVTGTSRSVSGYYTLGDGGGGRYFYDSASVLTDNGGSVIAPNVGTGRWLLAESETFNVKQFGAVGDGTTDDTPEIQYAVNAACAANNGAVYFPSGIYKIISAITLPNATSNISLYGDGQNVSVIKQASAAANAFTLTFQNSGVVQPYRCNIKDLGFEVTTVVAGTAISISYGAPASTSSHFNGGTTISNVTVKSNDTGYWNTGIDIESGWNTKITDCSISGGAQGSVWTNLVGSGIRLRRSCTNTHILNNEINFFYTGLYYSAEGVGVNYPNTEGLFCSNNSMVAVRRGAWIQGNTTATSPWVTGFQWSGGLIETREGIAGIQLEACSEARVNGTYIIDAPASATSIGVYMGTCQDIIISGNQIYAMGYGVKTIGVVTQAIVSQNHFKGGGDQVHFADGAVDCRSSLNLVNTAETYIAEYNLSTSIASRNRVLQGKSLGFFAKKNAGQSIADSTDTAVTWQTTVYDDVVQALLILDPATPSRIYVPKGVSRVKITAGIRWDTSAVGNRSVKIRTPVAGSYYPGNSNWASDSRTATTLSDCTVSTGVIDLDPVVGFHTTYFDVVVNQTSGGALDVRNVEGTYISMEILG